MSAGEVIIDEARCKGCGYCVHFCPRQCIEMPAGKFTSRGYSLPVVTKPEKCTGCGTCGMLCPDQAITVYRMVESEGK